MQLVPDSPMALCRVAEIEMQRGEMGASASSAPLCAYKAALEQHDDLHTSMSGLVFVVGTNSWRNLAKAGVVVEGGYPRPSELLAILSE